MQPGSASATLQNAICAGDAIIAANNEIYRDLVKKNGWLIDRVEEIADILDLVEHNPTVIENMKRESKRIGGQLLDYKVLANRMYKV